MAWTEITRRQYDRRHLRYASDCTDEEWALIALFMPAPNKVGRSHKWHMREVWNAIQSIAAVGCQWAILPKDFPLFTTVQHYFYRLCDSGPLDIINETLVIRARLLAGRAAEPTADAIAYTKESFPTLAHLFADGGDAGEKLETALQVMDGPTIELVKRPDGAKGFVVIARRWVVERTFAWLGRCRRLAKDWEATIASSEAWLLIAFIRRTTKLIARTCKQ